MLENIGYAAITETPVVIVDVQRAGPSTGQATRPAQGDVMQVRWGSHGDYQVIALAPWSVQEMYDLTIRAFNLAERFRNPVFVLADEAVGHLWENFHVAQQVRVYHRRKPGGKEPPFGGAEVPPMPAFGEGHQLMITGSTHDQWGYRRTSDAETQAQLVERLSSKITNHLDEVWEVEEYFCAGELDLLIIAYGFTARSALQAVKMVRQGGKCAGLLRLQTLWPFPGPLVRELARRSREVLVPEMNRGQILREVQRVAPRARGYQKTAGEVIQPVEMVENYF
jgi:2-oxoglutarate ferredoxin oxidoreductase subunit alpha